MAYRVVILESAKSELCEIVNYLVNILKNPHAASAFMDEFDHQVSLVESNPNLFGVSQMPELKSRNYHAAHIKNYIMLYSVREYTIYISHVLHQTQDYAKLV